MHSLVQKQNIEDNPVVLELVTQGNADERMLTEQAASGDANAFRTLFEQNFKRVFALCLRLSADKPAAEELTQDVFVKAWEKLPFFRSESKFSTWLHSIAVNEFLMRKRAEKRFYERFLSTDSYSDYEIGHTASTAEKLDLEDAMKKLPEQARIVFVLHDVEGYKHHEISELISIEVGTSKAHLHRARKMLRTSLSL